MERVTKDEMVVEESLGICLLLFTVVRKSVYETCEKALNQRPRSLGKVRFGY